MSIETLLEYHTGMFNSLIYKYSSIGLAPDPSPFFNRCCQCVGCVLIAKTITFKFNKISRVC